MNSGYYSFERIVEDVKQETGITNLTNQYRAISNMIVKAEYEINPYGSLLIRKRMIFHKGNGNFDGRNIKKPADFVQLDKVGCCKDGICSGSYYETISHIALCDGKPRDKVAFTYWGIQSSGSGYPFTTYNHSEAVVAYIVWKMYSQNVFVGNGSANLMAYYKEEWERRCMEARGEDFFPTNEGINAIRQLNQMTNRELDSKFCEDLCTHTDCVLTIDDNEIMNEKMKNKVYYWQFNSLTKKVGSESEITDEFLESCNQITLREATNGFIYAYPYNGRIGFAIECVEPDSIKVFDIMGQEMNHNMEYFYDFKRRLLIFISNEYFSQSSVFFKMVYSKN